MILNFQLNTNVINKFQVYVMTKAIKFVSNVKFSTSFKGALVITSRYVYKQIFTTENKWLQVYIITCLLFIPPTLLRIFGLLL